VVAKLRAFSRPVRNHLAFTIHNLVGHPLMEVAHFVGAKRLARWFHRVTLPHDLRDAGSLTLTVEAGEYLGEAWLSQKEIDAAMELYWLRVKEKAPPPPSAPAEEMPDAE
jgi:hypothetical protein